METGRFSYLLFHCCVSAVLTLCFLLSASSAQFCSQESASFPFCCASSSCCSASFCSSLASPSPSHVAHHSLAESPRLLSQNILSSLLEQQRQPLSSCPPRRQHRSASSLAGHVSFYKISEQQDEVQACGRFNFPLPWLLLFFPIFPSCSLVVLSFCVFSSLPLFAVFFCFCSAACSSWRAGALRRNLRSVIIPSRFNHE